MSRYTVESARTFLRSAEVFYDDEPDPEEPQLVQTINMNDCWGWALAWGCYVPDDKLPEVAELFWRYGWNGLLYWHSTQNDNCRSEFLDNQRAVDFVRHEEAHRKGKSSSEAAYTSLTYTLGSPDTGAEKT